MTREQTTPSYPPPTPTAVSAPFWEAAQERRLAYQRCADCAQAVFPPRAHCPHCWSESLTWQESTGHGTIASFTVAHRPGHPAFAELAPFVLALIDVQDGFRLLSRLTTNPEEGLAVSAPVRVVWESSGDWTLPLFELITVDGGP
ncbi:Zn-ribbon domain-containing OB-fold protein [Ornithinimicrobium cavernae]|uniref:Zn-ribbon domain-containing OB-fold protein n=1 Tax=Ornithinimicrobium cavernae TaxID=2666047 RepID=UPI000D6867C1|nr:Zn-ribbon domain-containing OB-fold protein [Ornithinimicrobium cavernae]